MFTRLAAFHRIGQSAYKPGLETTERLCAAFGNPHKKLKCIHVGGTNGKGSTAHTVAAILSAQGYKTGLFTSPHLIDYSERIRIDGQPIPHDRVVDFVERFQALGDDAGDPSFFELSTVMAFDWFARNDVDFAVIEVGLGGRLDSTNVITPLLSIITNISLDHTAILGKTRAEIAAEKAGIIKPGVPVVIGDSDAETDAVFIEKAGKTGSKMIFADRGDEVMNSEFLADGIVYRTRNFGDFKGELAGYCQLANTRTILTAVNVLKNSGIDICDESVHSAFANVCESTGLMGRWMRVNVDRLPGLTDDSKDKPLVICDTGHNPGAWQYLGPRFARESRPLSMVLGFVNDKDVGTIMEFMPRDAHYYFVQPSTPRAASSDTIAAVAAAHGLVGRAYPTVADGFKAALSESSDSSMIFVGGSTFVVADLLSL